MLNIFPDLITYILFAPLLLRVVVGILFLSWGYHLFWREKYAETASTLRVDWGASGAFFIWYLAIAEVLLGLALIAGFFTQIAAIVGMIVSGKLYFLSVRYPVIAHAGKTAYLLIFVICLSLLFTGAGAFGVDMPRL